MHFLAELVVAETRLVFAARRGAVENIAHQRKGGRKRERFRREENFSIPFRA